MVCCLIEYDKGFPRSFLLLINLTQINTKFYFHLLFDGKLNILLLSEMCDPDLKLLLQELINQQSIDSTTPFNPKDTLVLEGAKYVFDNSIDVSLNSQAISATARMLYDQFKNHDFSRNEWSMHELHPKSKDESTVDFIFTLDLLNFSFWSEKSDTERFAIEYKGKKWKGYWSLVAALQRALDEGQIPMKDVFFFFFFRYRCIY